MWYSFIMTDTQIKKYQSLDETLRKFVRYTERMKGEGQLILPPERKLCEELYCSRKTLRRLLEIQENEGAIVKKGKARSISMNSVAPPSIGSFAFVSSGQGMVANPAWNKLWTALIQKAEEANISSKLILIPHLAGKEEVEGVFQDLPELIVMTTLNSDFAVDFFREQRKKIIITTEEHYRGNFKNIVAMDNYQAGFMAAEKLAERGYKNPALICDNLLTFGKKLYVPYKRRVEGFRDGCRKFGLDFSDASEFWVSGRRYKLIVQLVKAAGQVAKGNFDSVFLHTDPELDFFYEALVQETRVPEDMGLVTVNSFDNAVGHNPPVSSVSHGTQEVAETLIEQIKYILETGDSNIGEIMVKPGFYEGGTL